MLRRQIGLPKSPFTPRVSSAQTQHRGPAEFPIFMPKCLQALVIATLCCATSQAADLEAGKVAAQAKCSQCHAASDWEGEDAASLESLMRDIAADKVKHSKGKIVLTPTEMTNIAAYWGSGGKAKKSKLDNSSNRFR